jgi:surfactin synthase thioesterase subunit
MFLAEAAGDEWFVSTARRPDASVTAVAFPHAGGGCAAFAQHAKAMPDWLRLVTLNLPGRQARFSEPLRTDMAALTAELAAYWAPRAERCLFFGYCSGALLAYRVTCLLRDHGATMPRRLVVGAYKPPHLATGESLADLGSQALREVLVENQAVPPQLSSHPEVWELNEPVVRADLALVAGYRQAQDPPLPIPITVLVGEHDRWLAPEDISAWAQYTTRGLDVHRLPTGHWFMQEDPQASAAALVAEAAAIRDLPSRGSLEATVADARVFTADDMRMA